MLLVGQQSEHPACKNWVMECWAAGMVICLRWGTDLHMAQLIPLPLTISCSSKSTLVLPFWCQLIWLVPDKCPLNRCCNRHTSSEIYVFGVRDDSLWKVVLQAGCPSCHRTNSPWSQSWGEESKVKQVDFKQKVKEWDNYWWWQEWC